MPSAQLSILQFVQTALRGINGASGGYTWAVPASTSVVLDDCDVAAVPATECPYVLIAGWENSTRKWGTSKGADPALPGNAVWEKARLTIFASLDIPIGLFMPDADRKQIGIDGWIADVETALCRDVTCGRKASYVEIAQAMASKGEPNQSRVFVIIPVDVVWRRTYGSP